MITPRNIVQHEFIGLETKIVRSRDKGLIGAEGIVVDETRKTLTVLSRDKQRVVPKEIATFLLTLPTGEKVEVEGWALMARPEDRIGMRVRTRV